MAWLKTILKALLSLALLVYLVYLADPAKILGVLGAIWINNRIRFLVMAAVIYLVSIAIFTLRWQVLVKGFGLLVRTIDLFKYYLISLFFNNFLPTSIGGDIVRIYHLIQRSGDRTAGFASVLMERLLGIASTLILTLIALLILSGELNNILLISTAVGLLSIIVAFFVLVFNDRFLQLTERLVGPFTILRLGERIMKFLNAIRFYQNARKIFMKVLVISVVGQVLVILMTYFLSRAIGLYIPLSYMFLIVPVTFLVTMLPSINGVGFREGGYIILLGRIGIGKAEAISLSFLSILIPMFISIGGGILFMLSKQIPKEKELEFVEKNI